MSPSPTDVLEHVQGLVRGMKDTKQDGPYLVTLSQDTGQFIDKKYGSGPTTLRERLLEIPGVKKVEVGEMIGVTSIKKWMESEQQ